MQPSSAFWLLFLHHVLSEQFWKLRCKRSPNSQLFFYFYFYFYLYFYVYFYLYF